MASTGISLLLASVFLPFAASRSVAFISGYVTMLFCNVFETLPATLIVFKMIDSVPPPALCCPLPPSPTHTPTPLSLKAISHRCPCGDPRPDCF